MDPETQHPQSKPPGDRGQAPAPDVATDVTLSDLLGALHEERSLRRFFAICWGFGRTASAANRPLRLSFRRWFVLLLLLVAGIDVGLGRIGPADTTLTIGLVGLIWYVLLSLVVFFQLGLFRDESGRQLRGLGIPNGLTIARILSIPQLFYLIVFHDEYPGLELTLLLTYGFIAMSDVLDGILARVLGQSSVFGRVFDPVCDMLFNTMMALALTLARVLPWWFALLVALRYFLPLVGSYFLFLYRQPFEIAPTFIGKANAMTLGFCLGAKLWEALFPGQLPALLVDGLFWSAALFLAANVGWLFYMGMSRVKSEEPH
jgi:cardiolipin synthase (CMP-forming)